MWKSSRIPREARIRRLNRTDQKPPVSQYIVSSYKGAPAASREEIKALNAAGCGMKQ
jgi:hypothetical protein